MTLTVIVLTTLNDKEPEALDRYVAVTTSLLKRVGAKIVQLHTGKETVASNTPAESVIIVDYPNIEALRTVFDSEEYVEIEETRARAFRNYSVSIVEY